MDLESTLIRAEALFKRFQRVVEAIDKKSNFPAPKLRPNSSIRKDTRSSSSGSSFVDVGRSSVDGAGAAAAAAESSSGGAGDANVKGKQIVPKTVQDLRKGQVKALSKEEKERVVSPELRILLRRDVPPLEPAQGVKGKGSASVAVKK